MSAPSESVSTHTAADRRVEREHVERERPEREHAAHARRSVGAPSAIERAHRTGTEARGAGRGAGAERGVACGARRRTAHTTRHATKARQEDERHGAQLEDGEDAAHVFLVGGGRDDGLSLLNLRGTRSADAKCAREP